MPELNGFDNTVIEPIGDFSPLPVGEYLVTITGSETKMPKPKADGSEVREYLNLTLTVQDGQYKGRKLFHGLHINHIKPDTTDIAKRTLSAICTITGVNRPKRTEELHDKPFTVVVGIRAGDANYPSPSNEIKGWKFADGSKIKAHTTNAVPAGVPASGGKGKLPWEKK